MARLATAVLVGVAVLGSAACSEQQSASRASVDPTSTSVTTTIAARQPTTSAAGSVAPQSAASHSHSCGAYPWLTQTTLAGWTPSDREGESAVRCFADALEAGEPATLRLNPAGEPATLRLNPAGVPRILTVVGPGLVEFSAPTVWDHVDTYRCASLTVTNEELDWGDCVQVDPVNN